jgi:thioredoxin-like negative regulator of GroEL
MKRALAILLLFCAGTRAAEIKWQTSYPDALKLARTNNSPMLVDLGAEWCGWCRLMDKETYTDPQVKNALANFVCVKVDTDKDSDTAFAFQVSSLPRTIVISRAQQIAGDHIGYLKPSDFVAFLAGLSNRLDSAFADAVAAPGLDMLAAVEKIVDLASAGGTNRFDKLIEYLASTNALVRREAAAQLRTAGPEVRAPLARALASPMLGTRIAACEIFDAVTTNHPPFDPWATAPDRTAQLSNWSRWLSEPK